MAKNRKEIVSNTCNENEVTMLGLWLQGVSYEEIGNEIGVDREIVSSYIKDVIETRITSFKNRRADILLKYSMEALNHLYNMLPTMTGFEAIKAAELLHKMERLERGESTQNITYSERQKKIEELEAKKIEVDKKIEKYKNLKIA